jgi:hypothetical protein
MKILALDPSGNFHEGKGITGWALFIDGKLKDFGDIRSEDFETQILYWSRILSKVRENHSWDEDDLEVVCESYKLQASKAMAQSWSTLETPQLIGVIRYYCGDFGIPIHFQDPSCKIRFSDEILVKQGIIEKRNKLYYCQDKKTNDHMRDAIRHGLYYTKYKGESK